MSGAFTIHVGDVHYIFFRFWILQCHLKPSVCTDCRCLDCTALHCNTPVRFPELSQGSTTSSGIECHWEAAGKLRTSIMLHVAAA
eukprot:m.370587 g.370587  ORF g.370587 m.370587 type:complete len:85 (-) comp28126_c0_seq58:74-328(-)